MAGKRLPLTITDEGDDKFIVTVGDRYTDADYRWNIIGIIMEWLCEGDDLEWLDTADGHKKTNQIVQQIMRQCDEEEGRRPSDA